jgi:23S rRNA (uridine2552-2'-O)-methyltransferase
LAKSNKPWLRRHVTDSYVRKAKEKGFRSRAAFKLLQIDDEEKLLRAGMTVLDLGAAPGGWSQVAAQKGAKVTAVDLLPMAPIPGVTVLRGDFREVLKDPAQYDVVLSDLSPNISGIRDTDQARVAELVERAAALARERLAPGGAFLVKVFHGGRFPALLEEMKRNFRTVQVCKPGASRSESRETYLLARGPRAD